MKHVTIKSEHDKLVIEAVVRRFGPVSRVEIHELTHLQHSAISRLTRELLQEGKLLEAGHADNSRGRKQVLLRLNDEHAFIVGISFDDENVLAATMDLHPRARVTVTEPTRLDGGVEGLRNQLLHCAKKVIQQAGLDAKSLLGIGLAGSGLVNTREGSFIISSTIDFWKQVPLRRIFEDEFGVPTLVENIARAKTVAERALGAGEPADNMVYVEYGTGIGAGIIIDGKLVRGSGYAAGEFGHTHMNVGDGPVCNCGSFGCLEGVAGAAALGARIRKAVAGGGGSEALALAGGEISKITGWTALTAARMGDKTCVAVVDQISEYLGLGLANMVNLFNPSMLVLDRRLSLAGQGLLDQIVKVVKRQALTYSTKELLVRFGELGSEAGVLGVGLMLLERHFEIPALKPPRFMIEPFSAPLRRHWATGSELPAEPTGPTEPAPVRS